MPTYPKSKSKHVKQLNGDVPDYKRFVGYKMPEPNDKKPNPKKIFDGYTSPKKGKNSNNNKKHTYKRKKK
jgi:hypothetical protein